MVSKQTKAIWIDLQELFSHFSPSNSPQEHTMPNLFVVQQELVVQHWIVLTEVLQHFLHLLWIKDFDVRSNLEAKMLMLRDFLQIGDDGVLHRSSKKILPRAIDTQTPSQLFHIQHSTST